VSVESISQKSSQLKKYSSILSW